MMSQLEILPNEIFLNIFCYLSWDEMLISLWSLNKRIDSLICLIFSTNKSGIVLNNLNFSYKTFCEILFSSILNSSLLSSNIKCIYFKETNSFSFDFLYQKIFYHNEKQKNPFPNLESLHIPRCLLSQSLIETLSFLIQHHLKQLTLTFNEDIYETFYYGSEFKPIDFTEEKKIYMFQQILCQIFSNRCQLTSLCLDITKSFCSIHQCLKINTYDPLNMASDRCQPYCITLRRLHIRLRYICFLEDLIIYVPNLEQISIQSEFLQRDDELYNPSISNSILPNGSWFNKIPKLKSFTLKSSIDTDSQFTYLKWLLNNINHVIKLELHLYYDADWKEHQTIWKLLPDASFIRQYCLPDEVFNMKDFHFYFCTKWQLSSNNIEKIRNSFKINSFFIDHQWTNVQCFYDERLSYQHIFSSNLKKISFYEPLINYPCVRHYSSIEHIGLSLNMSLYSFLEQFHKLCPYVFDITIHLVFCSNNKSEMLASLLTLFTIQKQSLNNIHLRNVTKIRFGTRYKRRIDPSGELTNDDKTLVKIFSIIISMTVQLKYIFIERLEWLLYISQYAVDGSLIGSLATVRHAEFGIPSCNIGNNESIHIGKHLLPLLTRFMPHLQTLCLWRPDDFPWTAIRPDFRQAEYGYRIKSWFKTLSTFESINEHVTIFEQDLCKLVERLKQLIFININGKVRYEKVEPYRLMVQNRFPSSRVDIHTARFQLWL